MNRIKSWQEKTECTANCNAFIDFSDVLKW